MRLGTVGFRVPNLAGVGFRKSGELVAITTEPAIHVWPADGSSKAAITKLANKPHFVALAANARFAAGVSNPMLTVWDLIGEKAVEYSTRSVGQVYHFAFSPDGTYLAGVDRAKQKLLLWETFRPRRGPRSSWPNPWKRFRSPQTGNGSPCVRPAKPR